MSIECSERCEESSCKWSEWDVLNLNLFHGEAGYLWRFYIAAVSVTRYCFLLVPFLSLALYVMAFISCQTKAQITEKNESSLQLKHVAWSG